MKSQLLPEGFRDSLPGLAGKENRISSIFIEFMEKNGFSFVKPPLLEFENSLFFLKKNKDNLDSFRVLDPLSQKMMGLRTDITLQVARMSCGSLLKEPRPLRLSYSGEVLKVQNNNLNMSRQFNQIGAEIIGTENNFCENEIIKIIIDILEKFKIKDFFISFMMPTLINSISKDFKLSKSNFDLVKEKFKNKNFSGLEKVSTKLEEISSTLLSSIGEVEKKLPKISNYKFPSETQFEINNFIEIVSRLKNEFSDYKILIDPLEIDDSEYHTGISFKIYSHDFKELFSGGKYKVSQENCIGFSGFVENLATQSKIFKSLNKRICVPINISDKTKKNLLQKDFVIIRSIKVLNLSDFKRYAKDQKCNFYLKNNKIVELD